MKITKQEFIKLWLQNKIYKGYVLYIAGLLNKFDKEMIGKIKENINYLSDDMINLLVEVFNKEQEKNERLKEEAEEIFREIKSKIEQEVENKLNGIKDLFYSDIYRWTKNIIQDYKYRRCYEVLKDMVYDYIKQKVEARQIKIFS